MDQFSKIRSVNHTSTSDDTNMHCVVAIVKDDIIRSAYFDDAAMSQDFIHYFRTTIELHCSRLQVLQADIHALVHALARAYTYLQMYSRIRTQASCDKLDVGGGGSADAAAGGDVPARQLDFSSPDVSKCSSSMQATDEITILSTNMSSTDRRPT